MTRRKTSLSIAGVTLLLLLLLLLLVTGCGGTTSVNTANTVSTPSTSGTTTAPTSTPLKNPRGQGTATTSTQRNDLLQSLGPYVPAFKDQLAQGLHLTATQLMQKVQAGQTLTAIAGEEGLSATQLSTLIASALSTSLAPAVKGGQLTQQQLEKLTQRLQKNPNQLDTLLAK